MGIINDTIRQFLNINTLNIQGWEIVCDECPINHKMYWQENCAYLIGQMLTKLEAKYSH